MHIRFNNPYTVGIELEYMRDAITRGRLAGGGHYTKLCHQWLEENTGAHHALLTHSCTGALEIAALLAEVGPGDEVIMPSFTFVSTANAFALRGAVPVFTDIRADTLNIDEELLQDAITTRTKAIVPVHYAGVGCAMESILELSRRHDLLVIEDAAQGLGAYASGRHLGTIGHLGTLSFHETKNVQSGEGGALLINNPTFVQRAEIIWEKGTNRASFARGEVEKYTWIDLGSSYLPGELVAAFLLAQLEASTTITQQRLAVWREYHNRLAPLEERGLLRRPIIPESATPNGHIYYVITSDAEAQRRALAALKRAGVGAVFHYVPLHLSPGGRLRGRVAGPLPVTEDVSGRLIRLPVWPGLKEVERIVSVLKESL